MMFERVGKGSCTKCERANLDLVTLDGGIAKVVLSRHFIPVPEALDPSGRRILATYGFCLGSLTLPARQS